MFSSHSEGVFTSICKCCKCNLLFYINRHRRLVCPCFDRLEVAISCETQISARSSLGFKATTLGNNAGRLRHLAYPRPDTNAALLHPGRIAKHYNQTYLLLSKSNSSKYVHLGQRSINITTLWRNQFESASLRLAFITSDQTRHFYEGDIYPQ